MNPRRNGLFAIAVLLLPAIIINAFSQGQPASPGVNFGSVNVGSASPAKTLTLTFKTAATLGHVAVVSQAITAPEFADTRTGSCTEGAHYRVGERCTVNVIFIPRYNGMRYGAVVLEGSTGHVVATGLVQGDGTATQGEAGSRPRNTTSVNAQASGVVGIAANATGSSGSVSSPTCSLTSSNSSLISGICTVQNTSFLASGLQTSANLGSVNAGSSSSATAVTLNFITAGTLGGISVLTQGMPGLDFANAGSGNCTVGTSYSAGSSCQVNLTFTPVLAGSRNGAVVLSDGAGNLLATTYVQGTGVGPQVNLLPGTETVVPTSAILFPFGVTVDGGGNIYIADSGNNRVLKETFSGGSYSETTVPTSTLSNPLGIAVDGAGNLYIADTGNNRVLIETRQAGSYTESTVSTSALSYPGSVAVDGSGNIYIADSDNNRVLVEALSQDTYTESTVVTSALSAPASVAVDAQGNVYIADAGNNRVLLESASAGGYTESTLTTSSLYQPGAVVVDGVGNVYIADTFNNRVLEESNVAGNTVESTIATTTLAGPSGVMVAGNGNVYIADTYNNRLIEEDLSDALNLSFAPTAPGSASSDSPKTVTVVDGGNAMLTFPIPATGSNPSIAANFSLSSGASSCPIVSAGATSAATLAAGQSCMLPISFTPAQAGTVTGALVLSDSALNATATQSLGLSGIGTGSAQQTITFAAIATQHANTTLTLAATASSGLPVSFTSRTSSACTVQGAVASLATAGTCTIQASQAGTPVYAAAATVTQSFIVNLAAQTITFAAIPAQAINTAVPVNLTASASSGYPVTFTSATPSVCSVSNDTSTASLLAVGTCSVQANQTGDTVVFAAAPTVTQSFAVEGISTATGASFGSVNIGNSGTAVAVPLTISSAGTLGSVSVLTAGATRLDFASATGGTCTAGSSFGTGAVCTANVTFTPTAAGSRYGAVVLFDGTGNVLATAYLQGTGVGPQVNFLPGTELTVPTSALANPTGIAVDGSGNVFIADAPNNRVLKETLSAGTYTESTVPTSTLSYPSGITVDGAGNLYIADTGNNRVLKEILTAGGYAESTISTSALNFPFAVAVDGGGNVYIADTGNNRLLLEALGSGGYSETMVPTSALAGPSGVAVDGSGAVYIADSENNRVLLETVSSGSYAESAISTGSLNGPSGIAVDGNGNLFIADSYNNRVLKEQFVGSSFVESTVSTSALSGPSTVAVAGNGNLYIADSGNNRALEENSAGAPSLNFASSAPGTTSSDSPQTITLENFGNAPLQFPVPTSGNNPAVPANFTLGNGGSTCPVVTSGSSDEETLAAGMSCALVVSFAPMAPGMYNGALMFTDTALNAGAPGFANQRILLSGTGTGSTQQTIGFPAIPTQAAGTALAMIATASSGLPVTFTTATPSVCTVVESAASLVAAGTCTIQASQAGSPVYAPASVVTQSFTVNLAAQTINFAAISTQVINTSAPVALTAAASSGLPVSFSSTTPVVCIVDSTRYTAALLTGGNCTIQANQAGDGVVYAAAPTVTETFAVESINPVTSVSFGSVNIGSSSTAVPVTLNFNTSATLGSVPVLTSGASGLDFANSGGGSCAAGTNYNAGSSCTINVIFSPKQAGSRFGAAVAADDSGNALSTIYLQGTGIGPQAVFLPGVETVVSSGALSYPFGVAVDGSGNLYVADTGNSRVVKEIFVNGSYTSSTVPTSTLVSPTGVAVDASGILYIADTGNNRVLMERLSPQGYTESVVPTSALNSPSAVAIDGSGNLYIADTNNNRVLLEAPSENGFTESVVPTSWLANPAGLAVDGNSDVYIADSGNNRVLKEVYASGSYTESTVTTSPLNDPMGVALDGSGNVYIADNGNGRALLETLSSGGYLESVLPTSSMNGPSGIAVANGNVFIADTYNSRMLKEGLAMPPSLSFMLAQPGTMSSDSPRTVEVANIGNAPLTFPVPESGNNPAISEDFTLNSSATGACLVVNAQSSMTVTLAAGQSCLLPISFEPPTSGSFSGTVALTDNSLNTVGTQSIQLSGSGLGSTQQTITFAPIGVQPVNSTVALTTTASSGLPVGLASVTPAVCMVAGANASLIAGGTCTIVASQAGSTLYASAASVSQSFAVTLLPQTISFPRIPDQVINTASPLVLLATSSSGLPVSFSSATPSICTVTAAASTARLLAAGTCTIQANQAGDGAVYAAAPQVIQSFAVQSPNPQAATVFAPVTIGSASSPIAVTLNVGTATSLGNVSVLTQGASGLDFANAGTGTCTVGTSYPAGSSCTVNVTFSPRFAGAINGAVTLADSSGVIIATAYLEGAGVGPQLSFLPGTENEIPISDGYLPVGVALDGTGSVYILGSYFNGVVKETPSEGGYIQSAVTTSNRGGSAGGVAVDGSGNVYIADPFYNRILKETLSAGSYSESTVPTSALNFPTGLAVDGSGNIYVADFENNRVLVESLTSTGYVESTVPTSSLYFPVSVAVDQKGNVYIADSGNNRVLKETYSAGGYTESIVPTSPVALLAGVSVDANGNLYIVDPGNSRILKETLSGSSYIESTLPTATPAGAQSVAVDMSGNVYIADYANDRVLKEDYADGPSMTFAVTAPGLTSSDSPQTVALENIGSATLNFLVPSTGNNPGITGAFTLSSGGASACPTVIAGASMGWTLAAGQSCQLPIRFTAPGAGTFSGTVALLDDTLNSSASQSILLTGSGSGTESQTISIAPIAPQIIGTSVTVTASASSGLPVTLAVTTPDVCSLSSISVWMPTAGMCTVQASQAGSAVYAPAATATISFAVNLLTQTITFPAIPVQIINTTAALPLLASASSSLPIVYISSTPAVCTISGLTAQLLADGTCTIQASQPGDGVTYAPAVPVTRSFAIQSISPVSSSNFGAVNIGSTSAAIAVNLNFSAAATLGSVTVLTQGAAGMDFANAGQGGCSAGASYTAGSSCTVNVTFTPMLAGDRLGAVALVDVSGHIVATSYVQGKGVGPQLNFLPSAETTVPSSVLSSPSGVALDGSGNIYIADTYNQRILKETPTAGGFTESTVPTSSLSYPYGVAVDGNGNLYIADTGDNRILKETLSAGSYSESTIPSTALNNPFGVAVDGSGNVYIADTNNNRVVLEALSGGTYTESVVSTSQLNAPYGVAVDGSGTVYIADSYNNRVLKEMLSLGTYRESKVPTSAWGPFGIAVDGRGSIYISNFYGWDVGDSNILKETYANGSYVESAIQTSPLSGPFGVAVDGGGSVYVADTYNNRVLKENFAEPPSLSFALTAPGVTSTDSPQTVSVENVGNDVLTFLAVNGGSNPTVSANFSINSSALSACPLVAMGSSNATTLPAGESCLLPITFAPQAAGVVTGTLSLTDNTLNAAAPGYATQSIQLNGTGRGSTQQTISFTPIPGQTVLATVALAATATSGLLVSFASTTPAICAASGSTVSLLAVGMCTIQATQPGDSTYTAASPVTQSFIVSLQAQTITFSPIQSQVFNTTVGIPLSAYATSGLQVNFTSTTPSVCAVSGSNAMLSSAGTCTIQASQPGDGVTYASAPVVTQSFAVQSVNPQTAANFGSVSIGSTSSPNFVTLTLNADATLGNISVLTQGVSGLDFAASGSGSCTAGNSYNVGDSCTVSVSFTPKTSGSRNGAVVLADGSGNVLATAYLEGTGTGPQVTFLPGTESMVSPGNLWSTAGLTVDGTGNIYIVGNHNNVIVKETLSSGGYTPSVLPTSQLNDPEGVAVDGAGNVYIADTSNYRVLKETPSDGGYTESTVLSSASSRPTSVAVDGSGNVYIADGSNRRILMEAPSAGSYTETVIPTSPLSWALGIAVDGNGNVYISDDYNYRVLKETASNGGYTESILPVTNLTQPESVTVDGTGDVYIAKWGYYDTGQDAVVKLTPAGSTYTQITLPTSALNAPSGVAVDGTGNVFISNGAVVLKEDLADAPSLNFALTAPGSTSSDSPQTVTVVNIGNAALTIPVLSGGNNPAITANFSLGSNAAFDCPLVGPGGSTGGTVAAGQSCLMPIRFTPPSAGTITGTLTLTDNTLNATAPGYATQTIQLTGLGSGSTPQTISFAPISAQSLGGTLTLIATATSGLTVVFTSTTPNVCYSYNWYNSSYVSLLTAGTCTIQASQPGSPDYAAAPTVTQSFTVTPLPQTITFGSIPAQVFSASVPVELVATASSGLPVNFTSSTPAVCTVSASSAILVASGQCTIQATQPGNTNYAAASPVTQSFTVEPTTQVAGSNLGSANVGASGSPVPITLTFNSASTLSSVTVLTQAVPGLDFANAGTGTCSVAMSYNIGDSCTVAVTFTPAVSGSRTGAVVLEDSSNNVLGVAYITGMGIGPQVNFLPGTESAVPSSALYPRTIAVDGSGSIYIDDQYNNQILKETLSAGAYTESQIPTSALNVPLGIAIDGGGNLYIADTYNNRVLKETPSAGAYTETVIPTSSLSHPNSIAVDGSGNIYVTDTGNGRVLIEVPSGGSYVENRVPNSAGSPSQIAVDGSGNVYIGDAGSNRVLLETLQSGSYTETTLPTSTQDSLQNLAVDGNGNVYITQTGYSDNSVSVLLHSGGNYLQKTIPTSSLQYPTGVAVDGRGNVYVTDFYRGMVFKEDLADAPTLNFAATPAGATSADSPQVITVENLGNSTLSFPVPANGQNPAIPVNFTFNSVYPFSCQIVVAGSTTSASLPAGQLCVLPISFVPTATGSLSSTLVLTDNALNATAPGFAVQNIQLNGTGTSGNQ